MKQTNFFLWLLILFIVIVQFAFYASYADLQWGGDIIEYYGTTESILNHVTPNLTATDQKNVEKILNPEYFTMPGWYIKGFDGQRYPVHFIFYSILILPIRVIFEFLHLNPLNSLRITNLLIFYGIASIIIKFFLANSFKKWAFFIVLVLSPLTSFIIWPGPDIYSMMLLLLAIFCFYKKRYKLTSVLLALSSWHSQPLLILALGSIVYMLVRDIQIQRTSTEQRIRINLRLITFSLFVLFLLAIPYLYNFIAFRVFTPWVLLKDSWTELNGFGLHNASIQKLLEQFFDLNIGLFWYAPVLLVSGVWFAITTLKHESGKLWYRKTFFVLLAILITAFFYQTNPAWHYGTAGYGPTRHALFIFPFLIFFFVKQIRFQTKHIIILTLFVVSQLSIFAFNGFLTPNFMNVLQHSPSARLILDTYPQFYNPSPEIFVDRTNHTDTVLAFAAYKKDTLCKKAYVIVTDAEKLIKECGFIPKQYQEKLTNPFTQKVDYPRPVRTAEATLWADPVSCATPLATPQYICLYTIDDVVKYTGVTDKKRWQKLEAYEGSWKLWWGKPVMMIVPQGYITSHYALEGVYVNY